MLKVFISLFNEYHRNQLHSQNKNINTYFYSYISEEITAANKITFNTDKQVSAICARKVLECFFFFFSSLFFYQRQRSEFNATQCTFCRWTRAAIKMSPKKVQSSWQSSNLTWFMRVFFSMIWLIRMSFFLVRLKKWALDKQWNRNDNRCNEEIQTVSNSVGRRMHSRSFLLRIRSTFLSTKDRSSEDLGLTFSPLDLR